MTSIANSPASPDALATRRAQWRRELLARRKAQSAEERAAADSRLDAALGRVLAEIGGTLGFYWPIQEEYDARPVVTRWLTAEAGRQAALPVVVRRAAPLVFRNWTPATPMMAAGFGTSVPVPEDVVVPDSLLIPLVGFDAAGYRLGYGGGFYDRTIAALQPRPHTIGIGYSICRLDSIDPQSYDLKLDMLIVA